MGRPTHIPYPIHMGRPTHIPYPIHMGRPTHLLPIYISPLIPWPTANLAFYILYGIFTFNTHIITIWTNLRVIPGGKHSEKAPLYVCVCVGLRYVSRAHPALWDAWSLRTARLSYLVTYAWPTLSRGSVCSGPLHSTCAAPIHSHTLLPRRQPLYHKTVQPIHIPDIHSSRTYIQAVFMRILFHTFFFFFGEHLYSGWHDTCTQHVRVTVVKVASWMFQVIFRYVYTASMIFHYEYE